MAITVGTIRRHNALQIMGGIVGILGAAFSTAVMFGLFWGTWKLVVELAHLDEGLSKWAVPIGGIVTIVIWVSGGLRYRQGLEGPDYWDSIDSMIPRGETAGATVVDFYASRVTAPAFLLSRLFLGAPRWLIDGLKRFRRLVPANPHWAERLEVLRAQLDQTRRWRPLAQYAEVTTELQHLHWMKIAAVGLREEVPSARISLEHQTPRDELLNSPRAPGSGEGPP